MKYLDLLEQAIEQRKLYGNEPIEGIDLPDDVDDLWELRSELKDVIAGARALVSAVEDEVALIVEDGAVRMGGSVATVVQPLKRTVMRPTQFWDFLFSVFDTRSLSRLFNPNNIRVGELKKLIEQHGLDYETVMDTLFDESREEPTLQVRPTHLAPKWQQTLPEGEVKKRRKQ